MSDMKRAVAAFRMETFFKGGECLSRAVPSEGNTLTYQLKVGAYTTLTKVWGVHPKTGCMTIIQYPILKTRANACVKVAGILNEHFGDYATFRVARIGKNKQQVHMNYRGVTQILDLTKPVDIGALMTQADLILDAKESV